ncbi:MAG TPA: hypothetical protein VFT43_07540 [Candidatus Polarisedimenticolia bacterium]|nr:hypothetical protein [Candidatus Polarisedimenticolia bacterium]
MLRGERCLRWAAASLVVLTGYGVSNRARAADLNGFLREKGHGDVAISYTAQSYDHFWAGTTRVADPMVGKVTTDSTTLWFDYGVTDRFTVIANLPYIDTRSDGAAGFGQGALQDITLLGKYRLASFGSGVRSTVVGAVGLRTIASNYEIQNSVVDIGDGTADWLARLVYQIEAGRVYVSQQIGFDRRGGDAPDGIPLHTEIGATWGPVTVNGFYSRLDARGGTDIGSGAPFPSNKEEYERAGGKVYARVSDVIGLSAMFFTTLSGRNTGDATGYAGGINLRF